MRSTRLIGLIGLDGAVLAAAVPEPGRLLEHLGQPSAWVSRVGADRAAAELAAAALWCVAAWTALGLIACIGAALPGAAGRIADRLARTLLPATLYRVVAGAAGLGVLLAPAAAGAASVAHPVPAAARTSAPPPAWPSDAPLPAPSWPVTSTPAHRPAPHEQPAPARPSPPRTVVVRAGDSLWSIAAEHLPSSAGRDRIAQAWPRWYRANRTVIGADPDLIRPGQVLHTPANDQEDRS